jgi:hypothetical protein
MPRRAAALCVILIVFAVTGCARPYSGPKTLAAIGAGLLVGGSTTWAFGERTNRPALVTPAFVTTLVGAAAVIAAGGWLAASISCRVDPDCSDYEECKEVPAVPGAIPYRQCVPR